MYQFEHYGNMIRDTVRASAYRAAIDAIVGPESVVLDLGAGTGAFAIYAALCGARKVYAVETNPLIGLGRQQAAQLGVLDRIQFFHGPSEEFVPDERATVLISDLRGALPFLGRNFDSLADARERLLVPGAAIIPSRDTVWVVPVSAPGWYSDEIENPWTDGPLGFPMPLMRHCEASMPRRADSRIPVPELPSQLFASLDYVRGVNDFMSMPLTWKADRLMAVHAYLLWFATELAPGIGFSAEPGRRNPWIYGKLLLPLSRPVEVAEGEVLSLQLSLWPVAGDWVYRWKTRVLSPGRPSASLDQHSMVGQILGIPGLTHAQ